MKLVLILMVKNESRIIRRCMESVDGIVDAFCVCDTGSTDDTRDIVKDFLSTRRGCLTETAWKNFGESRTVSFEAARDYVSSVLTWDLKETYGLLLDGDMVFVPGKLKEQSLTEIGYSIVQCAGSLEYPNCRLVRMDYPWKCVGVTHEYWDGPTTRLSKDICYIDDRNDGGCKSDKFERDARLLEKGLEDDPGNVRYMFYLAQTYHSLGRWKDSIAMYKRRIAAGGWEEEVWYSHYMIAQCHLSLKNPIKFEEWMLRAYERRKHRAEPLYKLAKYFREQAQHYKSQHYVRIGKSIGIPGDSLFVEKDVYTGLFDYEETINLFYLHNTPSKGLEACIRYMLTKNTGFCDNVMRNSYFYIEPLEGDIVTHPVLRYSFGPDYHPTSVSFFDYKGIACDNVRFVNYSIDQRNGSYMMKEGCYATNNKVRTQNLLYSPYRSTQMKEDTIALPRRDTNILGLEDVRVYNDASGRLCFVATSKEFSEKLRIVQGEYRINGTYANCKVLESPTQADCEKNWLPINGTDDIIYRWSPLEVGKLVDNKLEIHTRHTTPWLFNHLRGSAIPIRVDDDLWVLVHYVEYSAPRKYFHCFVKLDATTYKPIAVSLPFVFRERTIEYAMGCRINEEKTKITFGFSTMDDNPCLMTVPVSEFQWIQT